MPASSAFRTALAAGLGALALILLALILAAAPPAAAGSEPAVAYLRLAHLSPDTPDVDVYVGSIADPAQSFVVPGVGYGAVSAYRALPAGTYVIGMRPAGAPPGDPVVISTSVDALPGAAYTVAGLGRSADLALAVLPDRLDIPAPGLAAVRVINAAATAPTVDVGPAGGPVWASDVAFGTDTEYVEVPLGSWTLSVGAPGRAAVALPVQLDGNSVYTVLLVDRDGALRAELIQDSSGAPVVPVGGVETGFGGPAGITELAGAALAAVAAGLLAVRVSRRVR